MKNFIFTLLVLCCALTGKAQTTTDVATAVLQHGNQVSVFKGGNALVEAMAAAEDGDVITLSDGQFVPTHINKSVSIYGAGYESDAETGTAQSCLNGNVFIGVQGDTLCNVHLEGLYINGFLYAGYANNANIKVPIKGLTIEKCWMQKTMYMGSYNENLTLKQCVFYSNNAISRGLCKNTLITNCILFGMITGYTEEGEVLIDHSISTYSYDGNNGQGMTWTNCIFTVNTGVYAVCGPYSVVKNCLKKSNTSLGNGTSAENIYFFDDISQVFADGVNAYYSAERTWELQQPDVWIGTDGTQVGIHGGMGWSKVPRIPVIKSLELNVEGTQLRITYEAEARD